MTVLAPQAVIEAMAKSTEDERNALDSGWNVMLMALKAAKDMGYVMVPVEPTEEMLFQHFKETGEPNCTVTTCYQAMLAAAAQERKDE